MAKTKKAKAAPKKAKAAKPAVTIYPPPATGPKVLIYDIETAPIVAHVWGLWENNVGLNQIDTDWHVLSWSAKWLGAPENEVMYMDQRDMKNIEDDSKLLKQIWNLLDQCDVVITQNGKKFDQKKLNARFILNGFQPTSTYRHIDTAQLARKHFAFTSNKLAYLSDKLCTTYKKLTNHGQFPGHELWVQCLKGNLEAWQEMEKYNKYDVLSLEELYNRLAPWDTTINFNVYTEEEVTACSCGSINFRKNGFSYTNASKFQKYKCKDCGKEHKGKENLLTPEKKDSLKL
jgi:DNA polymerase elongation subunit (family B)